MPFASDNRFVYFADVQSTGDDRSAQLQAAVDLSFELTHCGDTKSSMRRDVSCMRTSIGMGKLDMKLFGSSLFGQAITAGVGAALMLSASVSHAQSGPFTGFTGSWSGNGTVALSDGTTERIRCKASYNVNGTGLGLKQTLRCASDSYKFDLSTDVTSQGDRISGNWSEASRNIFGNLQGTAGGGQIEVFVEASGFAASVTLRTTGNKQTVQISSKGEIRGVNITMSKGG
jgi:hypothetical protein